MALEVGSEAIFELYGRSPDIMGTAGTGNWVLGYREAKRLNAVRAGTLNWKFEVSKCNKYSFCLVPSPLLDLKVHDGRIT